MSKKLDNQYLNLAGAPWTPTNPSQGITLANYFAAAATTLCIGGAAALSPHLSGKEASALASEAALVTMASAFYCARVRRRQAQNISKQADHLVINTSPDTSTPPTSPKILTEVVKFRDSHAGGAFVYYLTSTMLQAIPTYVATISMAPKDYIGLTAAYGFTMMICSDALARQRQFQKIVDLEWVISDRGDAVGKFQNHERDKLVADKQVARVPVQHGPR